MYEKSIYTDPLSKLNEDTVAKKQKFQDEVRAHTSNLAAARLVKTIQV